MFNALVLPTQKFVRGLFVVLDLQLTLPVPAAKARLKYVVVVLRKYDLCAHFITR